MLYSLGRLMVRLRWVVIALWVALFLLGLTVAPRVASQLKSGFGAADTESRRALELLEEEVGISPATVVIAFSSDSLTVDDALFQEEMEGTLAPLQGDPQVRRIATFSTGDDPSLVSPDRSTTYALVSLGVGIDEAIEEIPSIRQRLVPPQELEMWVTGGAAIFSDLDQASERDLRRAEVVSFPLVAVALVLVFGSLVAAGLPLAMGGVSVVLTLALVYLLALHIDMSIFVLNIATFLGLGLAVDYSLLVVSRFREELQRRDKGEAIAHTLATSGRAILFSGITSVLGLSGLLFFKFMMLRSLGIGGVAVILLSMAVAFTLLPALLAVLGSRVNSLRVLPAGLGVRGVWQRLARGVMRHPLLVIIPVGAFLLVLGQPFLHVKIGEPWASVLPRDAESRIGWERMQERMGPGELSPLVLAIRADGDILSPQRVGQLYDFTHRLAQDARVSRVESITTLDDRTTRAQYQELYADPAGRRLPEVASALEELTGGNTTMVRVFPTTGPVEDATKQLVRDVRAMDMGPGLTLMATGATADLMDSVGVMYADFPKVIIYVVFTIYLALLWLFRSVVLSLKAVVMNALSIFASFGALVYIFQDGHFQGLLGFSAGGFTEASVPIIMFALLFGLSMDYEVFLLSRVKEEYDRTGDNAASVVYGMEHTGQVITSAALILVLVAGAFATGDIIIVKALGLGTAIAIAIDATIVRALLVPSLMHLLGKWNWWAPGFLKRLIPEHRVPT